MTLEELGKHRDGWCWVGDSGGRPVALLDEVFDLAEAMLMLEEMGNAKGLSPTKFRNGWSASLDFLALGINLETPSGATAADAIRAAYEAWKEEK